MEYVTVKRVLDVVCSFALAMITFPILIIVAIIMKIKEPKSSVFFTQQRIGLNEKPFKILKIRTMKSEIEKDGRFLSDKERLTSFGKTLRRTSIDELPQLINVFKGEMSFIGPRPLPPQYLDWYTKTELRRHNTRPGISGLAQIKGRNNLSWDEKLNYDVEYVDNLSFSCDLYIVRETIKKVLRQSDVVTRGKENDGEIDFDIYRKKKGSKDVY